VHKYPVLDDFEKILCCGGIRGGKYIQDRERRRLRVAGDRFEVPAQVLASSSIATLYIELEYAQKCISNRPSDPFLRAVGEYAEVELR